jgi:hypothetical protein
MVVVCQPDDVGCVPEYPVACQVKWAGDSGRAAEAAANRPLSPDAQAWCLAHEQTGSGK